MNQIKIRERLDKIASIAEYQHEKTRIQAFDIIYTLVHLIYAIMDDKEDEFLQELEIGEEMNNDWTNMKEEYEAEHGRIN